MGLKSLLHIGPESAETKKQIPELTKALIAVLNTAASDAAKQEAIRALGKIFHVENVNVSNCNFVDK